MTTVRVSGGRVIDPSQGLDRTTDLWIADGKIVGIGDDPPFEADVVLAASGLMVLPGLVDMHVHLREPGDDADETIATGARAALESGITSVACMPDTDPAIDNQAAAEFVILQAKRAGNAHIFPVGAVTKSRAGEELSEMGGLTQGGAVAFSDSDRPISNAEIMRRALQYSRMFGKTILSHPEVPELTRNGLMNEGFYSMKLGMTGMPSAAEEILVDRDLRLAAWTGGKLHVQNVSCAGSVESIRRAKAAGATVTAEVCPHHLVLTEERMQTFDSVYKTNPPLRTTTDVDALLAGIVDGTIDVIASGHAPRAPEQKLRELDAAPFGVIGMETLLPIAIKALIESERIGWNRLVELLAWNPARVLGIDRGTLQTGRPADVVLLDPYETWTIDPLQFRSKSRNCPFVGWQVRGRVRTVLVAGQIRFNRS